MMGSEWMDMGWWAMGLGIAIWILVLAVAVGLVVWLVSRTTQRPGDDGRSESAEEILRRRFARGEIDDDELQRRLSVLRR